MLNGESEETGAALEARSKDETKHSNEAPEG